MDKKITEKDILLDNLRICRCILNYKADENLISACRTALKDNVSAYDRLVQARLQKAAERKVARKASGGGILAAA